MSKKEENKEAREKLIEDIALLLLKHKDHLKTGEVAEVIIGFISILCGIKAQKMNRLGDIEHDLVLIVQDALKIVEVYGANPEFKQRFDKYFEGK